MELEFKRSAFKQLKYYKKKNPKVYKMIMGKLNEILESPEDIRYKKVKRYSKYKCARVGGYRICFKVVDDVVYIGRIDDRSNVYQ